MTGSPVFKLTNTRQKANKLWPHHDQLEEKNSDFSFPSTQTSKFHRSLPVALEEGVKKHGAKRKLDWELENESRQERKSKMSGIRSLSLGRTNSSSLSSRSCRRRLFAANESSVREDRVRLSLSKKFPCVRGQPSRSSLLLNLAFSSYNLSDRKSPQQAEVMEEESGACGVKSDVQSSAFKLDIVGSPVLAGNKRVKRKLNLDDMSDDLPKKDVKFGKDSNYFGNVQHLDCSLRFSASKSPDLNREYVRKTRKTKFSHTFPPLVDIQHFRIGKKKMEAKSSVSFEPDKRDKETSPSLLNSWREYSFNSNVSVAENKGADKTLHFDENVTGYKPENKKYLTTSSASQHFENSAKDSFESAIDKIDSYVTTNNVLLKSDVTYITNTVDGLPDCKLPADNELGDKSNESIHVPTNDGSLQNSTDLKHRKFLNKFECEYNKKCDKLHSSETVHESNRNTAFNKNETNTMSRAVCLKTAPNNDVNIACNEPLTVELVNDRNKLNLLNLDVDVVSIPDASIIPRGAVKTPVSNKTRYDMTSYCEMKPMTVEEVLKNSDVSFVSCMTTPENSGKMSNPKIMKKLFGTDSFEDYIRSKLDNNEQRNDDKSQIKSILADIDKNSMIRKHLPSFSRKSPFYHNLVKRSPFGQNNSPVLCKSNESKLQNLFKTSKLRSSLRDKIFDMSNHQESVETPKKEKNANDGRKSKCKQKSKELMKWPCPKKRNTSFAVSSADLSIIRRVDRAISSNCKRSKAFANMFKDLNSSSSSLPCTFSKTVNIKRVARIPCHKPSTTLDKECNKACISKGRDSRQSLFMSSHMERFLNDCEVHKPDSIDSGNDTSIRKNNTSGAAAFCDSSLPTIDTSINPSVSDEMNGSTTNKVRVPSGNINVSKDDFQKLSRNVVNDDVHIEDDSFDKLIAEINVAQITKDDECAEKPSKTYKDFMKIQDHSQEFIQPAVNDVHIVDDSFIDENSKQLPNAGTSKNADLQIENISSAESLMLDYIMKEETAAKTDADVEEDLCDSSKKRKKKKYNPGSLVWRLNQLKNRGKSTVRMWEYELSKKAETSGEIEVNCNIPGIFYVKKMWKECSRIVVHCAILEEAESDSRYKIDELERLGITVKKTALVILETDYCPKNLLYSSIFRIYPPWKIMDLCSFDVRVIYCPRKIKIISKHGKPLLYKDPTTLTTSITLNKQIFCECTERCDCILPGSYESMMNPILGMEKSELEFDGTVSVLGLPDMMINTIKMTRFKNILCSVKNLNLHLKIKYAHKKCIHQDYVLWFLIGVDTNEELCCIMVRGDVNKSLPTFNKDALFEFTGVITWKLIPHRNLLSFFDYIEFEERLAEYMTGDISLFIMSEKHGSVKCLF